jgi:hypothetical protein
MVRADASLCSLRAGVQRSFYPLGQLLLVTMEPSSKEELGIEPDFERTRRESPGLLSQSGIELRKDLYNVELGQSSQDWTVALQVADWPDFFQGPFPGHLAFKVGDPGSSWSDSAPAGTMRQVSQ